MTTTISRDSFARQETVRRVTPATKFGCYWCGGARKNGTLFQYGTLQDGSLTTRTNWDNASFCCKSCRDTYYE